MPTKVKFKAPTPTISKVIEQACIDVKVKAGYDVNIAEGRAFNKALWIIIARMPKERAIKYIAHCLTIYSKDIKKNKP